MFIKCGNTIINIKTVTHIKLTEQNDAYIHFIGNERVMLGHDAAKPLLDRLELVMQFAAREDAQMEEELYGSPAA